MTKSLLIWLPKLLKSVKPINRAGLFKDSQEPKFKHWLFRRLVLFQINLSCLRSRALHHWLVWRIIWFQLIKVFMVQNWKSSLINASKNTIWTWEVSTVHSINLSLNIMLKIKLSLMLQMNLVKCLNLDSEQMRQEDHLELLLLVHQVPEDKHSHWLLPNSSVLYRFPLDSFWKQRFKTTLRTVKSLLIALKRENQFQIKLSII